MKLVFIYIVYIYKSLYISLYIWLVKNFTSGGKETLLAVVKNFTSTGKNLYYRLEYLTNKNISLKGDNLWNVLFCFEAFK